MYNLDWKNCLYVYMWVCGGGVLNPSLVEVDLFGLDSLRNLLLIYQMVNQISYTYIMWIYGMVSQT